MVDQGQDPPETFGPVAFGKYLLDREIATGGMARVYLARLRGLGGFEKRLVVKQILPHLAEDPRFVEMFVDEAKKLVALSHPHVVPVYELGVEGGVYFLAMEHVEGATLADMLAHGPLSPSEAAQLGTQVADALAYAHERFGLVHRDVTPRNVMVEGTGHARLLDFGIAARTDEPGGGGLYGTPGYLSPEQARGERLTSASDVFSLGCVLYEAAYAAPLFSPHDLDRVRNLSSDDVAALVPGTQELDQVIRRCIAPAPEDRFESARALMLTLRTVARAEEDPTRTLGARAERARLSPAQRPKSERPPPAPGSGDRGAPKRGSATLATSELLGNLLSAPGTAKLDRPRSSSPGEAPPAAESQPPARVADEPARQDDGAAPRTAAIRPARSRTPSEEALATSGPVTPGKPGTSVPLLAALSIGIAALAGYLAWRAELDPPAPDVSLVETDTDATTFIPPEDTGTDAGASSIADAGTSDAGMPDTGEAEDHRGRATLRVTSDGSLSVRVDGRAVGHAPVAGFSLTSGEHRLSFDCDFLDRSAEERILFAPGATVRIRVTCNTNPPRVSCGENACPRLTPRE